MDTEGHRDRFQELEKSYRDYTVYDQHYEKIGKVDDLFVDADDQPEYIGVKTGFLGTKSTLIPMDIARVNDRRKLIEVAADRDMIKDAPTFDNKEEMTPDHEHRIHSYFGLERPNSWNERGGYGDYYQSGASGEGYTREELERSVDTEYGERMEESPQSPMESTSYRDDERYDSRSSRSSEERYDSRSSRSDETGRDDLDIPLERTESERPGGYTERPAERTTSSRDDERYADTRSSRSDEADRDDLGVPLERAGSERPRGYTEPREETVGSSTTFGGPEDSARTEESGQTFTDEKEVGGMRVHKRIRR